MSKIIKLIFFLILSKTCSDLVAKTLVYLHEVFGSNIDDITTKGVLVRQVILLDYE